MNHLKKIEDRVISILKTNVDARSDDTVKDIVWNKQVSIVDWGYGPKYDFRKWTENFEKCSKGICLNQSEIDSLLGILENLDL